MTFDLHTGLLLLNLVIGGGSLWKLIDLARQFGKVEQQTETNARDIAWLRDRVP